MQHDGKCAREHGHSYRFVVDVCSEAGPQNQYTNEGAKNPEWGMLIDFGKLKAVVKKVVVDRYDHRKMQDFFKNPTAEIMLQQFVKDINAEFFKQPPRIWISYAELWETATSCAVYRKD